MSNLIVKKAVSHFRKTRNLKEALSIALGSKKVVETGPDTAQSQVWYVPNEDALNQFKLKIQNYLPDATVSEKPSEFGYEVTVSGTFSDDAVATLATHSGLYRLDQK